MDNAADIASRNYYQKPKAFAGIAARRIRLINRRRPRAAERRYHHGFKYAHFFIP
jgi:hypothetical protein